MNQTAVNQAIDGLRDVVALNSDICSIENGVLCYRGYNIDDLAENSNFEEVVYLLWNARLPKRDELESLRLSIAEQAQLPEGLLAMMKSFPRRTTPMEAIRTAASAMAMFDAESEDMSPAANGRKAVRILGQMASVVAAWDRIRNDRAPLAPRRDLTLAGNFLYMLTGLQPEPLAARALDKAYILHADHELNASTFAARVAAGTLTDMHSAVTAAICALKGPLHGGANEQVMRMLNEIGGEKQVEPYIRRKLDAGRHTVPLLLAGELAKLARHLLEMAGARIAVFVDRVSEPHDFLMIIEFAADVRLHLFFAADFVKHPHHLFIGAPVQRTFECTNGGRDG